ncbi:hypothetical protein IAT40_005519 [Kwoniella sp. CBS 6097]
MSSITSTTLSCTTASKTRLGGSTLRPDISSEPENRSVPAADHMPDDEEEADRPLSEQGSITKGTAGTGGTAGTSGTAGNRGEPGKPGKPGKPGRPGKAGEAGTSGTPGTEGTAGTAGPADGNIVWTTRSASLCGSLRDVGSRIAAKFGSGRSSKERSAWLLTDTYSVRVYGDESQSKSRQIWKKVPHDSDILATLQNPEQSVGEIWMTATKEQVKNRCRVHGVLEWGHCSLFRAHSDLSDTKTVKVDIPRSQATESIDVNYKPRLEISDGHKDTDDPDPELSYMRDSSARGTDEIHTAMEA